MSFMRLLFLLNLLYFVRLFLIVQGQAAGSGLGLNKRGHTISGLELQISEITNQPVRQQ